jgi:hypothetical protein
MSRRDENRRRSRGLRTAPAVSLLTGTSLLIGTATSSASASAAKLCGSTGGPVTVTGLKENGTLTLSGDTGGITLSGSSVNGLVHQENNAGPTVSVAGNTVTGSLYCTGNNPVPSDNGSINIVSGACPSEPRS